MRKMLLLPLIIILSLVIAIVTAYTVSASRFANQSNSTFTNTSLIQEGNIGATIVTPEGMSMTLLGMEQQSGQVRFHLKLHNTQNLALRVWNVDPDHGFALYNQATKSFEITPVALPQTDLATHPALHTTLDGLADTDGWIAFAVPSLSHYQSTLFYRYHTVHTTRCPNTRASGGSIDLSKCEPADLYSTIQWNF